MRRTCALLPAAVLLLAPMTAHPQDGVHLELLAGPLFEPTHVQHGLHVGWTAGLGISYDLSAEIQAVHSIRFCRYPDGDWTEAGYYSISDPAAGTFAGGRVFHNGYEVSTAFRIGAPATPVWSYLSLQAGVQSARIRRRIADCHHAEWISKGFVSAGIGATVPVRSSWKLLLESRVTLATDGAAVFVPVVTGLQLFL